MGKRRFVAESSSERPFKRAKTVNGSNKDETRCRRCWQVGHLKKDCTNAQCCRNCGSEGHKAKECTQAVECHNCGKTGHFASKCPLKKQMQQMQCRKCGEHGHFEWDCTKMEGEDQLNGHQIATHLNHFGDEEVDEPYDDQPIYEEDIDFLREGAPDEFESDYEYELVDQPQEQPYSNDFQLGDDDVKELNGTNDDVDDQKTVSLSLKKKKMNRRNESVLDKDTEIEKKKKRFDKNAVCKRCGKKGHSIQQCLQPKGFKKKKKKKKSGNPDSKQRERFNKLKARKRDKETKRKEEMEMKAQKKRKRCAKCGGLSHSTKECSARTCFICHRFGHLSKFCPYVQERKEQRKIPKNNVCVRCNNPGHWAKDCTEPFNGTCYRCGKTGHFKSECKEELKADNKRRTYGPSHEAYGPAPPVRQQRNIEVEPAPQGNPFLESV